MTGVPAPHLATAAAFVLSFSTGAVDAFAFLELGGIFTANMTGNLILAGMYTRPDYLATLAGATVAVLAFAGALYAGFRLTDARDEERHCRVPTLLWVSVLLQAAVVAAGVAAAGNGVSVRLLVIALSAGALALQTAGARRITEFAGVTTTYVTGTMTSVMHDLADHRDGHVWMRLGSLLTLVAGAVTGTAVISALPALAPLISAAAVIIAVVLVRRVDLHRR
ncbi:membrane protein [Paractinoplanes deccanensis]|uniref:Membrane protein n=1 Tax=Paractinoplanes deccanensis TaxID=113561 RepID=A0ABQ3YJQ9_9ACTN|nr:YoaK family protein [Actinoplanes deccanensis]GID80246.1 membrane protein [Actinoplanes deccanensis]